METKPWYMSKAIWAGIASIIILVYNALVTGLSSGCGAEEGICINLPNIPAFVLGILAALGIYGRGSATTKVT